MSNVGNFSQALAREKEDRDVLAAKLRALEEKLVHGTNNDNEKLLEKAKQKELELALREQQLQEKESMDEEREKKIAELEVDPFGDFCPFERIEIRVTCLFHDIVFL